MSEITPDQIATDLHYRRQAMNYFSNQAEEFGDRAVEMRTVARNLASTVDPLRRVFNGIRIFHTNRTWQGNAATASRNRLDTYEDRHGAAIRSIDRLIDSLEEEALIVEQQQATALDQIGDLRWQIHQLEQDALALTSVQ